MRKIGFGGVFGEEEEEKYIYKSYIACPNCKDEFRTDKCPQKEEEKMYCSCKNLEIGCMEGDGVPAKAGSKGGFITIRYKKEYPLFVEKEA
jgi:hypothetical protein